MTKLLRAPVAVYALIALALPNFAHAGLNDLFADLFGRPERPHAKLAYEVRQLETRPVRMGDDSLALRQHAFEALVPLNSLSDRRWSLVTENRFDELRSEARFPDGRGLPRRLVDLNLGVNHLRELDGGRTVAGSFLIGSASDTPFRHVRDLTFQATVAYKVPAGDDASWLFLVQLANNRNFANYLPIPGVAYFFRPAESLRLALGVPFLAAFWTPFDKAVFNISYFPLNVAQARFSYFFFGPAQAYLQARYQTKNYFVENRAEPDERLFYEEAVAQGGVTTPLERNLVLDAYAGLSFDRKYFFGKKTTDKRDAAVLRPDRAPFAALRLIATF